MVLYRFRSFKFHTGIRHGHAIGDRFDSRSTQGHVVMKILLTSLGVECICLPHMPNGHWQRKLSVNNRASTHRIPSYGAGFIPAVKVRQEEKEGRPN